MNTHTTTAPTFFDRPTAQAAIDALKAALGGIDIGFKIEPGKGSFSHDEVTVQIKMRIPGAADPTRVLLEKMCRAYGFDPDASLSAIDLGSYKLVEYYPRSPKYPWGVVTAAGKRYKLPHQSVVTAMAKRRQD
ncbi:hypothetical protein [Pseudomonas violetae]|uniref:Uncharacterized protein n=1 Tax=Pseudomonas violetae TaxID=2915813 RepID=A0ABT0EST5_9PSED|nr:hypothetical protein [Pseudomonas violetae]MCK1788798.1 hypothetical protein [Pseudomonas violetae]